VARLFAQVESEERGLSAGRHTLRLNVRARTRLAGHPTANGPGRRQPREQRSAATTPSGRHDHGHLEAHSVDGKPRFEVREPARAYATAHTAA